jgi:hypothetical protein
LLRREQGRLKPLPEFIAILNPHDQPYQTSRASHWCGLLPLLSNSRITGNHHDLLMPDYSFAPHACAAHAAAAPHSPALARALALSACAGT